MSEETTVKFNLAFAEPLGCYTVSVVAFLVAMIGLGAMTLDQGAGIFTAVAIIFLLGAFISYLNSNLLCTMVFGTLAVYFLGLNYGVSGEGIAYLTIWAGLLFLVEGLIAYKVQPIRVLPILLFFTAAGFFVLGATFLPDVASDALNTAYGVLFMIVTLIALYLGSAVSLFLSEGKEVLPLLMKK
ncbi:hypothetical protein [Candidatus Methanomassiliicoccus intestinalis]|uniref:hypothetical protein n=1 Tax=Candidatus Methanomassiliicoccus intestinalis TaxID=1406512 RepID=UPI0037DD55C8